MIQTVMIFWPPYVQSTPRQRSLPWVANFSGMGWRKLEYVEKKKKEEERKKEGRGEKEEERGKITIVLFERINRRSY